MPVSTGDLADDSPSLCLTSEGGAPAPVLPGSASAEGAEGTVGFLGEAGRGPAPGGRAPRAPRGPGGLRPDAGGAAEGREPLAFGRAGLRPDADGRGGFPVGRGGFFELLIGFTLFGSTSFDSVFIGWTVEKK